jgi:hypothetical protein
MWKATQKIMLPTVYCWVPTYIEYHTLPRRQCLVFYSWDDWLIRMQEHRGTHFRQVVLLLTQTLGTISYDKQSVKWSDSCYSQFTPYKRDPLSSQTVAYMGHKASPHVAKGKKYFGLPGPLCWHATTVLAKPFCNWYAPKLNWPYNLWCGPPPSNLIMHYGSVFSLNNLDRQYMNFRMW